MISTNSQNAPRNTNYIHNVQLTAKAPPAGGGGGPRPPLFLSSSGRPAGRTPSSPASSSSSPQIVKEKRIILRKRHYDKKYYKGQLYKLIKLTLFLLLGEPKIAAGVVHLGLQYCTDGEGPISCPPILIATAVEILCNK